MATGSNIIGFKNRVEKGAKMLAEAQSITIITSKIVYDLSKAVEEFLTGARGPAAIGEFEVIAIFNQERADKQLIGGRVINGVVREKAAFEVVRSIMNTEGKQAVITGRVLNLREKKAEITQAEKGKEVGAFVSAQALIQIGDKLIIKK